MPGLAAFPILEMLSRSASVSDRAHFVRVFADYFAFLHEGQQDMLPDWLDAYKACLENAPPRERAVHLAALAQIASGYDEPTTVSVSCEPRLGRASETFEAPRAENQNDVDSRNHDKAALASEDIWALLRDGDLVALIAHASNPSTRFGSEEIALLVTRARLTSDEAGDRRLACALLARSPVCIEMAPLFLEATSEQRWGIALAAQRAELGRRNSVAFATIGRETIARLEYAAITGNSGQFHDLLSRAIGASLELAARIAEDPTGEPLVMALTAIGAPNDVCVRILAANDMQERGNFRRLNTLSRLSGSASPLAARRILAAIISGQSLSPTTALSKPTAATRPPRAASPRPERLVAQPRSAQPRNASTVGAK